MALTDLEKVDLVAMSDRIERIEALLSNSKYIEVPLTINKLVKKADMSYRTFKVFEPKLTAYYTKKTKRYMLSELIEVMKTKP